jgi:hypothetical protein
LSWNEINLKDVKPERREEIALGDYVFELLPGTILDDRGAVKAAAAIADEGSFRGRRAFFSFPDPNGVSAAGKSMAWSAQALKKFEQALGIDADDGENPVDYLNRVAGTRFGAAIVMARQPYQDGSEKHELGLFTFKPAV